MTVEQLRQAVGRARAGRPVQEIARAINRSRRDTHRMLRVDARTSVGSLLLLAGAFDCVVDVQFTSRSAAPQRDADCVVPPPVNADGPAWRRGRRNLEIV